MKKVLATAAALAAAASMLALAPGAQAQTEATLTVTATGTLTISAPVTTETTRVNLGSLPAGGVLTDAPNPLGTVSVSDTRAGLVNNNWTASVKSTDFVSATTATPITVASIGYKPGTVTSTDTVKPVGIIVASLSGTAQITVPRVGVGTNSANWSPVLSFTIGNNVIAGTYTGTITHSVL